MKYWTFLVGYVFSFASCIKGEEKGVVFLHNELIGTVMIISSYITGKQKEVDDRGQIIGETSCEKNFSKAYALFPDIANNLKNWPKITGYPISQALLQELNEALRTLMQNINSLPDSHDKKQFMKQCNQLTQYVSSLIKGKDVQ